MIKYMIKKIVKFVIPQFLLNQIKKHQDKNQLDLWKKNGCPVPPPHLVKQLTIAEIQKKYGHQILVETGTYMGDMVEAQKTRFKKIISIELGIDLFKKAQKRFRKDNNVLIVQGDSGVVLSKILEDLFEPAIFWLDGHYSEGITAKGNKECPIFEELDSIFNSGKYNHILLIDDARCFVGIGDYPSVERLTEYVRSKNNKYQVEIKNDIIRYVI
jgi:hypothetical protein